MADPDVVPVYCSSASKRVFDFFFSSSLLLVFLPLMVIIAVAIVLTSPGPALFKQERTGKGGKTFKIFKFRTMYEHLDAGVPLQASRGDPRVTRLGRLLRMTSLDELPQLVNVLQGDMSIVGPRPHAVAHDRIFGAEVSRYVDRFAVKPGMTGLAQVSGSRGILEDVYAVEERTSLDLDYIANASLAADIRLVIATAREVFFSRVSH